MDRSFQLLEEPSIGHVRSAADFPLADPAQWRRRPQPPGLSHDGQRFASSDGGRRVPCPAAFALFCPTPKLCQSALTGFMIYELRLRGVPGVECRVSSGRCRTTRARDNGTTGLQDHGTTDQGPYFTFYVLRFTSA